MKCDTNTMLKTAAGLAVVAGVIYFTVPAAQAYVMASLPILIVLICPISMLIMMKMMRSNGADARDAPGKSNGPSPSDARAPDAALEPARAGDPALRPDGTSAWRQEHSTGRAVRSNRFRTHFGRLLAATPVTATSGTNT